MGGSRRRLKRNAPKVKVGVIKRKKISKAQVPVELLEQRPDLEKRLNTRLAAAAAAAATAAACTSNCGCKQRHSAKYCMEVAWIQTTP
jgi:hypothetical protein